MFKRVTAILSLFATVSGLTLFPSTVNAQTYPSRPVRLIATYPPGGSSDLMARILAQKLSEQWGQPVVVENKPGAAGSMGMEYAARLPPDGYSFVIGNLGPAAVNPLLTKVPYDMNRDFIPVSLIATGPNILVVKADSPYKSLQDLVSAARAKPGTINYGTSGPGSMSHLATEMLKREGRMQIEHIPYKGGVLAVQDLLGGHVQMVISDSLPVAQYIRSGRLRALALTSATRSSLWPDIPTFEEGGIQGLVANNWWGVYLPAGTPKAVADKFQADLAKVMVNAELKEKFQGLGVEAMASSQADFRSFLNAETAKYGKLISENGIRGE
ncbi:MAG: hypothetical protein JWQ23_1537 [Herminiimonas sp.]|jgi:tripartite-type tricarboxylate transporter receptor subunit TctC|nr:hypothetical protein [Herminiimonas sp.]